MLRTQNSLSKEKIKLTCVTVPFSGHFKVLSKLARELSAQGKPFDITFLITGWSNIHISDKDKQDLMESGIKVIELHHEPISSAQPMSFTFPRVATLTDEVIANCQNSDFIMYDFFAIEGYIAGKKLGIPSICSIPAIMGPFHPDNKMLNEGKEQNKKIIQALEKKYDVEICNTLEIISDGFFLPSDYKNIQWSWPSFIESTDYHANRQINHYQFMRPEQCVSQIESDLAKQLRFIKQTKKVIYVSLGTVVTQNLWDNVPDVRLFILSIFNNIKEKFQDSEKYEVVIATGRDCQDVISDIPKNFHVYKSVSQPEILALSDVFVTHAGGNSVNEAIDAETPMVAIPFFGDQHICASNISQLKIGIAFPSDDNDLAINTMTCFDERNSMRNSDALCHAIEMVVSDKQYKKNILVLKNKQLMPINQFEKMLVNNKALAWQEGDLLYGCNDDRAKLAEITGRNDFFRLCDTREFPHLFNDIGNQHSLPRIIDQYHDVLTLNRMAKCSKFNDYNQVISEYGQHIQPYLNELKCTHPHETAKHDQIIWDMCVSGLEFFIKHKKKTIHFVVGKYNDQINLATKSELTWIKNHWQDEDVKNHVKFYNIQNGKLIQVNPEQSNWLDCRPTPTLDDIAPGKLDKNAWKSSMQAISAARPHLFFNRSPERYKKEMETLLSSGIHVIDIKKCPDVAKHSLASGEVHIFAIQKNGIVSIAKRISENGLISHAVVAGNKAVISAGEVRLRPICVKGKWLKAIDISNRSGHYRPGASTLLPAIKAFEELGYIVHRVNAVHEYVPSILSKVEDEIPAFEPITKSARI